MKSKLFQILLATAFIVGVTSSAHAAYYVGTLGAAGSGVTYTIGGDIVPGKEVLNGLPVDKSDLYKTYTGSPGTLTLSNAAIVNGTDTSGQLQTQNREPLGLNGANYLAVFGETQQSNYAPGKAIFDLNKGFNTFSFDWGSINYFNGLELVDGNDVSYTFTGTKLLSILPLKTPEGKLTAGTATEYFSITALSGIKRIILSSYINTFEAGNITISSVPLPAALPMFAFGVAGLAGLRARKRKACKKA